jgi:hypothetical protein
MTLGNCMTKIIYKMEKNLSTLCFQQQGDSAVGKRLLSPCAHKVETPIHDNIRELVTWECKEHGVKS